jgi:hypothetical protein
MFSGSLNLTKDNFSFDKIISAHSGCVEIGTIETPLFRVCFIVEKDALQTSVAKRCWGQTLTPPQYEVLKKEILDWSLQSIVIEQSRADGTITVTRNHHATCPLYLFPKGKTLYFHWDAVELYPHLNQSDLLDIKATIACLELLERYREKTVFKNLFRLLERGQAVFDAEGLRIIRPPHIEPPEPVALKDDADPIAVFHDMLRKNISRWGVDSDHIGAILSSGLDTTIVAHLLQEQIKSRKIPSYGYHMLDAQQEAIKAMRMETVQRLGLNDYYPPIKESSLPDAYSFKNGEKWWPEQTQTVFAEQLLTQQMQKDGITLAFTGIGGDELCMLSAKELIAMKLSARRTMPGDEGEYDGFSLISKKFVSQTPAVGELAWPNGYMGYSVPEMANSVGVFYLRKGIWFANPLASADLHLFTKFLPAEWRRRRRLSREALTRLGYSDNFTKQQPKEDLETTMVALLTQTDWEKIFRTQSALCDFGLIERNRLFEAVDIFKNTHNANVGIKIMVALHMEFGLRSASH